MKTQPQQLDSLILIETDEEIIVAWADNPEDWVARFKKEGDFPAHYWASRMQSLHAERMNEERSRASKETSE